MINWKLIIGGIIWIVLMFGAIRLSQIININKDSNIQVILDSLSYYKNKDSLNVATIGQLRFDNTNQFLKLEIKDKEYLTLQKTVENYKKQLKNGGSVTITNVITQYDTAYIANIDTICPERNISINNEWIDLKLNLTDSVKLSLSTKDEFEIINGKRDGKNFIDVINHNPYSTVRYVTSVNFISSEVSKKKRIVISSGVGYTLNSQFELKPAFYIGVGFKLFEF